MKISDLKGKYTVTSTRGATIPEPQPASAAPEKQNIFAKIGDTAGNVGKGVIGALTSSEQKFGSDLAGAASQILPKSMTGQDSLDAANKSKQDSVNTAIKGLHQAQSSGGDTSKWLKLIGEQSGQSIPTMEDLYPALKKSNLQVLGDAGGVLLDVLSAGSYGKAGAETGKLLKASSETMPASQAAEKTLGQTLGGIAKNTAKRSAVGAGTGYAYDVTQSLQDGKTGKEALTPGIGTIAGGSIPAAIGAGEAIAATAKAITKEAAPRIINSLVKPKAADFSYGKDPGRTVSELGITGNTMDDFAKNIGTKKEEIGKKIGNVYSDPANASIRLDLSNEISKIDNAMSEAAKGGKNNQAVVTQLQNIKDALVYDHALDSEGAIIKSGDPKSFASLDPQQAFELKKTVAEGTQFTGRPSDDKKVNSVLKSVFGGIKEKLNAAVGKNNPEILKLNQQFADLTSAEIAAVNRDAILKRANLVSMPVKFGTAAGLVTAVATGGTAIIPSILVGVGAGVLDKALGTPAVKTRIAAWLGSQSPEAVAQIVSKNPGIKDAIYRLVPKLASQLGGTEEGNKSE